MKTTTDNHIDKLLHEAMKQRAAKVPPLADDFAEKVLQRTPLLTSPEGKERKRRVIWPYAASAVAACIVIAFLLWPNSSEVVEQPVVAEVVEQPAPEAPKASDSSEYSEYSDNSEKSEPSEPVKPKRTHKARKVSKAVEEPLLAQADPLLEEQPAISTQAEESVAEYQNVQIIRVAADQVVFNVQTADMPMMAGMPSVGELRARGQQLLANVHQQIKEASKQF